MLARGVDALSRATPAPSRNHRLPLTEEEIERLVEENDRSAEEAGFCFMPASAFENLSGSFAIFISSLLFLL